MLMSAGLPVSANAINKDVGVHTKVCLNVRLRVVSPARIAERTASPEIRLKLYHTSGLRGSHQHLIAEAPSGLPAEAIYSTIAFALVSLVPLTLGPSPLNYSNRGVNRDYDRAHEDVLSVTSRRSYSHLRLDGQTTFQGHV